jgi:acyl carrier protein
MTVGSAQYVRAFIMSRLNESLTGLGLDSTRISNEFDLLTSGAIDSLGLVELIAAIEQDLGCTLEMSDLDPENLTIIGPLSEYIESQYMTSVQHSRRV